MAPQNVVYSHYTIEEGKVQEFYGILNPAEPRVARCRQQAALRALWALQSGSLLSYGQIEQRSHPKLCTIQKNHRQGRAQLAIKLNSLPQWGKVAAEG